MQKRPICNYDQNNLTATSQMVLLKNMRQIKSNHTVGVVQQLPFDTRETTSQNPNTNQPNYLCNAPKFVQDVMKKFGEKILK